MTQKNATILKADFVLNHGALVLAVTVDYGGAQQGAGGYVLETQNHGAITFHYLRRLLDTFEVESFAALK